MKFIELIAKGIGKVWDFCSYIAKITIVAVFVLFVLSVIMPENAMKAIEIFRNLMGSP